MSELLRVVSIHVSDLHLSYEVPRARAETQEEWLRTQSGYLRQLADLKLQVHVDGCAQPVMFYAGDIFHTWNEPAEVINLAIAGLPKGYAVPGQHDLPNHDYDQIRRSAYWTLVQGGTLTNMESGVTHKLPHSTIFATGFPWGTGVTPYAHRKFAGLHYVAVAHSYAWIVDRSYKGAPQNRRLGNYDLRGYDLAHFGDNHLSFKTVHQGAAVYNPGGFMRRRSDEKDHSPQVGLFMSDGTLRIHYLDVSKDKFVEGDVKGDELETVGVDTKELVGDLEKLIDKGIDFAQACRRVASKHQRKLVGELILSFLEKKYAPDD